MWAEYLVAELPVLGVMLVLLVASGFFSGTETALFSLSRGQIYRFRLGHHRLEHLVAGLMRRPHRVLNTLLLSNMAVNVAYAATSAVLVRAATQARLGPWGVGGVSLAPLLILILFGEVAPKMLAGSFSRRWATTAVLPLHVVERVILPLVVVLERAVVGPLLRILAPHAPPSEVRADELAALLDLSAKRGVLDHDANALLQEIVGLTDLRVGDVMVHRTDMITYDVDAPPAGLVELFERTRLRKVPVYEGDADRIIGIIRARRLLLEPGATLRSLVEEVVFVPETGNLERTLVQFRSTRTQMAIVVDEYGGTAGLITLEDILEEIVGDIPDPYRIEEGPAVEQVGPTEYIVDGDLSIHAWDEALNREVSRRRVSTIGGLVASLLGRIPRVGDEVEYRNLTFAVESTRGRRVGRVRLHLRGDKEPGPKEKSE